MAKQTGKLSFLLFLAVYLWLMVDGIYHRTVDDFVEYTAYIAMFQGTVVYYRIALWWRIASRPKFSLKLLLLMVVVIPLLLILVSAMYYALWSGLKESFFQIERLIPSRIFEIGFTVVSVILAGFVLFLFRLSARFFYGLTEAIVGVIVAVSRIPFQISDPASWEPHTYLVMLTAGVYLLVRGFDNMHTGLKPESYDGILKYTEDTYEKMWKVHQARLREPIDVDDEVES